MPATAWADSKKYEQIKANEIHAHTHTHTHSHTVTHTHTHTHTHNPKKPQKRKPRKLTKTFGRSPGGPVGRSVARLLDRSVDFSKTVGRIYKRNWTFENCWTTFQKMLDEF